MAAEKKIRPSPTVSATEHEVGTVMTGNDGNEYIVAADKNGKHRWAKHKAAEPRATKEAEPEEEPTPAPEPTKTKKPRATKKAKEPEPEPEQVSEPEEPAKTEKKKPVRKAPTEPAKEYDEGYEMEGLDGRMHVVRVTKAGIKRWVACH